MNLTITWFGHAAFLLEADNVRVMLDPYRAPDAGGYAPIDTQADIILVSHLNPRYHSHWEAAIGNPIRLNGLDFALDPHGAEARGIRFHALPVWESPAREEPVTMPHFTLGGVSICHSGDLGHALTPSEAVAIQGIDVFLAVAGGPPTVSLPDLKAAIDLVQPKIVIPMHYQTGKINLNLRPLEDFLEFFSPSQIIRHPTPTLTVSEDTLPAEMQVVVLPSAR